MNSCFLEGKEASNKEDLSNGQRACADAADAARGVYHFAHLAFRLF